METGGTGKAFGREIIFPCEVYATLRNEATGKGSNAAKRKYRQLAAEAKRLGAFWSDDGKKSC
jgi:hypothetical protein